MSSVLNILLLLIFGILEIILLIFSFIYAREKPMLGVIPLIAVTTDSEINFDEQE